MLHNDARKLLIKAWEKTHNASLSRDDIIIMDNMRFHHAKAVKQVLDASGIRYLYCRLTARISTQ